jgi:hypothetical protein
VIIVSLLVVLVQVIDLSAGDSWATKLGDRISFDHIILYTVILMASVFIQLYFLKTTTRIVFKIRKASSNSALIIAYLHVASQITVIILLVYLLGEQLVTSRYNIVLVQLIVGISLIISILIMVTLAFKCIKTYLSTRSKMAGVYSIAIIALSLQLISAFLSVEANLQVKPQYIYPDRNPSATYFYTSLKSKLDSLYETTKVMSFIAVWIASLLLTKSYAQKIGEIKYWITVSIPVIYFLFQYSPLLLNQTEIWSSLLMSSGSLFPILYNFVLNTVNVGTAILFGTSFFILSRGLTYEHLKYYLIIFGAGIMIIFSSSVSTILILSAFPAWGVVSISFVLPASFLILIGLDSASFYVAGDIRVRSYLSSSKTHFELFRALASAKASSEAEHKINQIINQIHSNVETEALFTPKSESEDFEQYVGEVIAELKKTGTGLDSTKSGKKSDQSTT